MSAELGAVVTNPKNGYAQLETYNTKSVWGPPVSPIVPPMQYVQLPHDYNNYGYNSLSHDFNGVGYYSVETGYGKRCTSFHTAQCPSNQPIKPPAPPIVSTPPPLMKESFVLEKKKPLNETVQNLKLVIFVDSKNCPHSESLLQLLKNNNLLESVQVLDITEPSNRNALITNGANGVPFIRSMTLGTSITGAPPSIELLVKALDNKQPITSNNPPSINPELLKKLQQLDIVVYTSDSCHYCVMYKSFIQKAGLLPYMKIIDLTNKEQVVKDPYLQTNQLPAIPFTYSKTYKTSFPGLPRTTNKAPYDDETVQEIITVLTSQST